MGLDHKSSPTEGSLKALGNVARETVLVDTFILMVVTMKVAGKMTLYMVMVP